MRLICQTGVPNFLISEKRHQFDISEYTRKQMYEIREGLGQGVDVSVYDKSEIDDFDMSRIREKLVLTVIENRQIKYFKKIKYICYVLFYFFVDIKK